MSLFYTILFFYIRHLGGMPMCQCCSLCFVAYSWPYPTTSAVRAAIPPSYGQFFVLRFLFFFTLSIITLDIIIGYQVFTSMLDEQVTVTSNSTCETCAQNIKCSIYIFSIFWIQKVYYLVPNLCNKFAVQLFWFCQYSCQHKLYSGSNSM